MTRPFSRILNPLIGLNKGTLTVFLFIFFSPFAFSQQLDTTSSLGGRFAPDVNFNHLVESGQERFDSLNSDDKQSEEGPEVYFQRWKSDWQGRIGGPGIDKYEAGSFKRIDALTQQLTDMEICAGTAKNCSDWDFVGPDDRDQHDKGIVVSVAKHPNNNDIFYAGTNSSGVWKTTDDGQNWTNLTNQLNVPGMGVQSIAINPQDPSTIYIGTGIGGLGRRYGIGVLKSTNGGSSWKQTDLTYEPSSVSAGKRVFDLAIHPNDTSKLYALVNESVYISDNGGGQFNQEWSIPCPAPSSGCCNDLEGKRMLRDIEFYPDNKNVIFISSDDNNATSAGPICNSHFDGGARVWVTSNDFNSATDITPSIYEHTTSSGYEAGSDRLSIDASSEHPKKLFIIGKKGGSGRKITAIKWNSSSPTNHPQPNNIFAFASSFPNTSGGDLGDIDAGGIYTNEIKISENSSHKNKAYIGGVGYLTVEMNFTNETLIAQEVNGNDFAVPDNSINSNWHQDTRALLIYQENQEEHIVQGNDGGVSRTKTGDFREDGESMNGDGLDITQFYGLGTYEGDADFVAGGTQDNNSFRYFKGGQSNWKRKGGGDMGDVEINDETGEMVSVMNYTPLEGDYPLTNGWSSLGSGKNQFLFPNDFLYNSNNNNWFKTSGFRSYSGDSKIKNYNSGAKLMNKPLGEKVEDFAQAPSDPDILYAVMKGRVWGGQLTDKFWRSSDGGNSWTDLSNVGSSLEGVIRWHGISDIAIDPEDPDRIWIVTNSFNDPIDNAVDKVLFSNDGGNSWTDISGQGDLPGVPMHEIVYQKGSDDHLYVATEVGVFHNKNAEPGKGDWECFSNELPTVTVTDLEINYCAQEIWASTYGRGIWRSPIPSLPPKTISSNTTWYQDKDVHRDLRVANGATFSIWGTVNMADGKRIIVEPGARLIVRGTVTNKCGRLWRGIEVRGDSDEPQNYSEQGALTVNGGTLSNANTAVETNKENAQGNIDYSTTGGIVIARNATFQNNRRAVEFLSYENRTPKTNNLSYFRNCSFISDQDTLNEGRVPEAFITMWEVQGIEIDGCDFKYTASQDDFIPEDRGKGIRTINARFSVDNAFQGLPPNVTKHRSHFEGLHYGIEAESSNIMRTVDVEDAVFTDNIFGIYLKGVDNAKINRNHFDLASPPGTHDTYGTYFMECDDYGYMQNSFEASQGFSYGTIIYNPTQDSANTNLVYKNEYEEDVSFSQIFMGNNAGTDPNGNYYAHDKGLKFDCNTYREAMSEDVWITYHGKGVSIRQGVYNTTDPQVPVANRFKGCPGGELDIRHEGTAATEDDAYMDYHHHDQNPYTPGKNCYSTPEVDPDGVSSNNPAFEDACPNLVPGDVFPGGIIQRPDVGDLKVAIRGLKEKSRNSRTEARTLSKKIDGNDTQGLLDTVQGEFEPEEIKTALMGASPYLSDKVLLATIDAGLPTTMLGDVLVANSPLADSVHQKFQDKRGIPKRTKERVAQKQEGVSPRMELKSKVAHYRAKSEWLLDRVIREYVHHDSIPGRMDSLEGVLKRGRRNDAPFRLVQLYDEQGKYQEAKELLNEVEANEPSYRRACDLQRTLIGLHEADKSIMALKKDANKEAMVREVAEVDDQKGSIRAQAILEAVFGEELEEVFPELREKALDPDENGKKKRTTKEEKGSKAWVVVHPNPATDRVNVHFKGDHKEERWLIELRDLSGRRVKGTEVDGATGASLSTQEVGSGIYFLVMRSERTEETLSKKLMIQKE